MQYTHITRKRGIYNTNTHTRHCPHWLISVQIEKREEYGNFSKATNAPPDTFWQHSVYVRVCERAWFWLEWPQPSHPFLTTVTPFHFTNLGLSLQQGVRFDPDMPQTIRLEFAKSNTKVSKPKQPAAAAATSHPALMHPLTGRKYAPPLEHMLMIIRFSLSLSFLFSMSFTLLLSFFLFSLALTLSLYLTFFFSVLPTKNNVRNEDSLWRIE